MKKNTKNLARHIIRASFSHERMNYSKKEIGEEIDFVIKDDEYTNGYNKSWAGLIKKIYEVD